MSRPGMSLEARVIGELEAGGCVLVSRLQYLGDVVLTLPVIQALRVRYPNAEIDYLTRGASAELLKGEPTLKHVFRVPEPGEGLPAMMRLIRRIRERRYTTAIDLYSNPRSALLMWLSGARLRLGGERRVRKWFYTHPVEVPSSVRAATDFHLHFLRCLDIEPTHSKPSLTITKEERKQAAATLERCGLRRGKPIIGIHPGGKWEVKRWPITHYAELAQYLIKKFGVQIAVMCGPGEELYLRQLQDHLGERAVYLPVLPIRQVAAVLQGLDAVVLSDGGIMHVAVAVATPTVGIFGSSEPEVWFPYERHGPYAPAFMPITCRPCHMHVCSHTSCLKNLTVDIVADKLVTLLAPTVSSFSSAR
jgi:lipopolysaccharide heptosyltransferase II